MGKDNPETNPLELSDEDFLKINPSTQEPSQETEKVTPVEEEKKTKEVTELEKEEVTTEDNKSDIKDDKTEEKKTTAEPEKKAEEWKEFTPDPDKSDEENAAAKAEHDKTKPAEKSNDDTKKDDEKNPDGTPKDKTQTAQVEDKPVDYKAVYDKLMTPFKANGKEIKLNNVDEAIRLMQMGAGYGRKLQDLQPHLKTIRMLEKNNLLDTGKLSFLIDLDKKNPDAIKKFIKDSGIDPLDLNTDDKVTYSPTNHSVSDSEFNFNTALNDVLTLPGGKETVQEINTKWDKTSKQALWESPEILGVIQSQRENGLYDQISTEIDRQKLLGHIPPNTPFLAAYKTAGDLLVKEERLIPPTTTISNTTPASSKEPTVIETRVETVKSQVSNSDKAEAAAPTKATARKAAEIKNPLEMPDEEFLKQFNGRL